MRRTGRRWFHPSSATRGAAIAVLTAILALPAVALTAPPVAASSLGTSQTELFEPTELAYGEPLTLSAEVRDVSDSCTGGIHSCDAPHGQVDFYAVQGTTQTYLAYGPLYPDIEIFGPWSDTAAEFDDQLVECCLEPGTYTIRGYYVPGDFDPSSADSAPLTITKNGSTVTMTADDTSLVAGQTATFHLHVSPYANDPRAAHPSGDVTIWEGSTSYGTGIVDGSGNATVTTALLPPGSHSLRATYSGDTHWNLSYSSLLDMTVDAGATMSSLGTSDTSVTYGDDVSLTTTVQAVAPALGTPTGSVAFDEGGIGGTEIGTATLNEAAPDRAVLTLSSLDVGSHTIQAFYGGDDFFNSSTSNSVTITVGKANSSTSLVSSANPATLGHPVTFTASVAAPGTTTATGTVQFRDGGSNLGGPQPMIVGTASLTVQTLSGGTHSITAVYSGSTNLNGSTSNTVAQVIACDTTITGSVSSVTTSGGSTCLSGAKISGNVTVTGGGSLSISNSTITGGVTISPTGTKSAVVSSLIAICGSTVAGNVTITATASFALLGDPADDACAGNWFKGTVLLSGNHAGLAVDDNRIGGSLVVTDNVGEGPGPDHVTPEVEANRISGYLTVARNTPAVVDEGRRNLAHGRYIAL